MITDKLLLTAFVLPPHYPIFAPRSAPESSRDGPAIACLCVIRGHSSPLAPLNPADHIFLYKQSIISH